MKWMVLPLALLLSSCSFNDEDKVAYKEVIAPASDPKVDFFGDSKSIDVTTTKIKYI